MKIRPLQDRVLVQQIAEDGLSTGGIIIPDTSKEKPQDGKVFADVCGCNNYDGAVGKPGVKKGDSILFGKYSGNEIDINGIEHLIMREDDILGVVEG